jgi:hypothetical protein
VVITTEYQRFKLMYTINPGNRNAAVIILVPKAGLFLLMTDGINAILKARKLMANSASCQLFIKVRSTLLYGPSNSPNRLWL